ncbi:hypothetical protein BDY17DRAFT_317058 [Neohortaea acidophila]|uniref:CNNM transmembrane domain-containing protein n=1 Tax=Neohortaea acidophila TaxID=245834 RepID=A0A6A6PS59_9PEZI|nr:uncharacterized protein BDY17DRAFT_317058 [Neohortaea acidophila]KAF2482313.1 hypothetical protein BDY17DRAFT_317058 [Neohortaea acidophila]
MGNAGGAFGTLRPAALLLSKALFLPLASAIPLSPFRRDVIATGDDPDAPKSTDDPNLWLYLGIAVALVLLGGVFAGLTIAFMGQDETYLQVIATSGDGAEKRHARKVLNLLQKGKHWVLVTLLLSNVITNETLPIVLDRSLGGGWPAVLSSTVLIVIFGEIAPQSVCVRFGLSIGAFMAPFVLILMWVMAPVAWPTAKLLDWLLGEDHGTMYKKAGLKTLVQLHKSLGTTPGERLMEDEVTIINSVLDLKEKPVGDIMTPMQDVFIMSADTVLDERMMDTILSQGYSRIPIYAPDNNRNFIGMLLVKILITYDPEDGKRVRDFALATLPETLPHTSCLDIINFFQEGKSHMVLVSDFPGHAKGALGVVTLEDVIEELIGEEIVDESDVFIDVHKAIRRMAPAPYSKYNKRLTLETAIDSSADAREDEPLLAETDGEESKSPARPTANGRQSTFLVRRKSSTASEGTRASVKPTGVPVRTSTMEMREHLKHLGPSNAASKPRETKFKSVTIKPGVDTIPEGLATAATSIDASRGRSVSLNETPTRRTDEPVASDGTNEADGLLRSAGRDASDGTAALRAGYGTVTSSTNVPTIKAMSADDENPKMMSPEEASRVAEENAETPSTNSAQRGEWLKVPGKLVVGDTTEADDSVGELQAPSRDRSRSHRRGVRSGSITETEVEIGGMKKVVLGTTSSSDDEAAAVVAERAAGDVSDDGTASDVTAKGGVNGSGAAQHKNKKKRGGKKKKKH